MWFVTEFEDGYGNIRLNKEHIVNGKLHHETEPARVFASGRLEWFYHGDYHRIDGPAIEYSNTFSVPMLKNRSVWYIYGYLIDDVKYKEWIEENGMNIENLSEEDKLFIDLAWKSSDFTMKA